MTTIFSHNELEKFILSTFRGGQGAQTHTVLKLLEHISYCHLPFPVRTSRTAQDYYYWSCTMQFCFGESDVDQGVIICADIFTIQRPTNTPRTVHCFFLCKFTRVAWATGRRPFALMLRGSVSSVVANCTSDMHKNCWCGTHCHSPCIQTIHVSPFLQRCQHKVLLRSILTVA